MITVQVHLVPSKQKSSVKWHFIGGWGRGEEKFGSFLAWQKWGEVLGYKLSYKKQHILAFQKKKKKLELNKMNGISKIEMNESLEQLQ